MRNVLIFSLAGIILVGCQDKVCSDGLRLSFNKLESLNRSAANIKEVEGKLWLCDHGDCDSSDAVKVENLSKRTIRQAKNEEIPFWKKNGITIPYGSYLGIEIWDPTAKGEVRRRLGKSAEYPSASDTARFSGSFPVVLSDDSFSAEVTCKQ